MNKLSKEPQGNEANTNNVLATVLNPKITMKNENLNEAVNPALNKGAVISWLRLI